jgi:hypothetical protein
MAYHFCPRFCTVATANQPLRSTAMRGHFSKCLASEPKTALEGRERGFRRDSNPSSPAFPFRSPARRRKLNPPAMLRAESRRPHQRRTSIKSVASRELDTAGEAAKLLNSRLRDVRPRKRAGDQRDGGVAQLVRVPDCRSGGCGFEPRRPRYNSNPPISTTLAEGCVVCGAGDDRLLTA